MTKSVRLFAAITRVLPTRVRHTIGLPLELADGEEEIRVLPRPDVVVIVEESRGNVFLYRMTRREEFGGDTWHPSVEDAKHQAEYEYGSALGAWLEVPDGVSDACGFAVAAIGRRHPGDM